MSAIARVVVIRFIALLALTLASPISAGHLPVIPGESGFGIETVAGSGRHLSPPKTRIFRVTHLQPSGPGSLQDCIRFEGPRTCLFEVGGTLDLTDDETFGPSIEIINPYLTIAGQTAPSPGITIKGKQIRIHAHDILIQHIRIRVSDEPHAGVSPIVRHGIEIIEKRNTAGVKPYNIVIDHCSISWGIDETVSVKSSADNVVIINSIISEGLGNSLHPKGEHSMGLMVTAKRASVAKNIFANTNGRTPLDTASQSVIANNLLYNTGESGITLEAIKRQTTVVGNVRIRGPDSDNSHAVYLFPQPPGSQIYASDNVCADYENAEWPCVKWKAKQIPNISDLRADAPPILPEGFKALPSTEVVGHLGRNSGARPNNRDSVDSRIVASVGSGNGKIPDCVTSETKYYPVGVLEAATLSSATFPVEYCFPGRFVDEKIEIVSGKGEGQVRSITAHDCKNAAVVTVSPPFDVEPLKGSAYRIANSCLNNAGGWPHAPSAHRKLQLPSDPDTLDESGYTQLERFLHAMSAEVEQIQSADAGQTTSQVGK